MKIFQMDLDSNKTHNDFHYPNISIALVKVHLKTERESTKASAGQKERAWAVLGTGGECSGSVLFQFFPLKDPSLLCSPSGDPIRQREQCWPELLC